MLHELSTGCTAAHCIVRACANECIHSVVEMTTTARLARRPGSPRHEVHRPIEVHGPIDALSSSHMQDHTSSPAAAAHDVADASNTLPLNTLDWRNVTDPEEVLALWRVLHDGRWRVVDAYNEGSRRFVIARVESASIADVLEERLDPSLSLRERQVACFAALGHTNKHIGHALAIATSTVATHLRHALQKLGARSRADLARRLLAAPEALDVR